MDQKGDVMNGRFARRNLLFSLLVCGGALILCVSLARAQSAGTGAIAGVVTDSSGAAVANVTVTATNLGTNQERTATTGAAGDYKFSLLSPGNYRLRFTANGFKTAEVSSVTVDVTETPTVNQTLEVGAVTQTVRVESNVETLQTESSTLGTTVTGNTLTALPLSNRNYTQVLSLSAGTNVGVSDATSLGRGTQDMSVNGMDPGQNNFQMDGVAVNNIDNGGSSNDGGLSTGIPIPSPDAIAEFKVQTSTYDASYGRNPGANVNVVTKSGTNDFHGSVFEFLRNSVLNADDFFYKKSPGQEHQVLDQNQFGGTIGGPIKKDKLFFFLSYQGTRSKNGVSSEGFTSGVTLPPIPNENRGTCPAGNVTTAACDATAQTFLTDVSNVLCTGFTIGPALTGPSAACGPNQGAPNMSIQGLRILQLHTGNGYYIPSPSANPNCSPGAGPSAGEYVCDFSDPALYKENQGILNVDYVINSKNTLSTRYLYTHNPQFDTLAGDLPGTPEVNIWGNHDAVLKLTSILTNNLVNEARISYQRNVAVGSDTLPVGASDAALGITPNSLGTPPPPFTFVGPTIHLFGAPLPYNGPTNQLQFADQISWSRGKHNFRFGFEHEDTRWPLDDLGIEAGLLIFATFNDLFVGQPSPNPALGVPGSVFQCLFCISAAGDAGLVHFYHLHNHSAFAQDDWKVSSRLTLNLGLRWEYDGMLTDSLGNLTNLWLSQLVPNSAVPTSLAAALANPAASLAGYVVPENFARHYGPLPAGVLTAANDMSLQKHPPYSNFAPRFGFAWQPLQSSKLVVRGGAGIFYDRISLGRIVQTVQQGNPYAQTLDYTNGSPRDLEASLANPYPPRTLVPMPTEPSLGFAARWFDPSTGQGSGLGLPLLAETVHTPLIRQYNLGIQYEFRPSWVLELGYVGSSSINLTDQNHNVNTAALATPTNDLSSLCTGVSPDIVCNTAVNVESRVPYLGFSTAMQVTEFNGISNYNSLQATVRHQFGHGLSMQASYTWSQDLTDIQGETANSNNASLLGQQYGRAWFNRPNRFVVNYSYDLPFGKSAQGIEGKLIKGWNVSGVTVAQSGDPLTFVDSTAGVAYGTAGDTTSNGFSRAEFCPGMGKGDILTHGSVVSRLNDYFNAGVFCTAPLVPYGDPGNAALGIPAATDFGNSGVGPVLGPGQFNWDISLIKNTPITERIRMQFRADFYNAFNHPEFADPVSENTSPTLINVASANAGTFGVIDATIANPRLIQFGLKFIF
jgi:hypothetical protein